MTMSLHIFYRRLRAKDDQVKDGSDDSNETYDIYIHIYYSDEAEMILFTNCYKVDGGKSTVRVPRKIILRS